MEKKRKYTEREAVRSRENRRKAKEKQKKNQALYDFVSRRYKFIVDEFEEEYHAANGDNATDPIPSYREDTSLLWTSLKRNIMPQTETTPQTP